MRSLSVGGSAAAALLVGLSAAAPPFKPHGPHEPQYIVNQERARAVKEAFQVSWDGYYEHAFPHDSLRPVSNGYADDRCVFLPPMGLPLLRWFWRLTCARLAFRNGWGASAVDAFSTALVMENWDVIDQILEYVPTIDFNKTETEVSLFETTIRYLGGLVSGTVQMLRHVAVVGLADSSTQLTISSPDRCVTASGKSPTWKPC